MTPITGFQPRDPQFQARVKASFDAQPALRTLGASLASIAPGAVSIRLEYRDGLARPGGPAHHGIAAAVLASACELAALSLTRPGAAIVPVEHQANFVSTAPAGEQPGPLVAYGEVVRSGGTITVCKGRIGAGDGAGKPVAHMLATYITESGL